MIISKPKRSTIISLTLFLILVGALIAATFTAMGRSEIIYWYHYIFLGVLIPTELGVFIKMIFNYKVLRISKGKFELTRPALFSKKQFLIKDISMWKEVVIKTASGVYQQLEVYFEEKQKFTLGKQEHTNYEKVVGYLKQKAPKRQLK